METHGSDKRAEKRYAFKMNVKCAYDSPECENAKDGLLQNTTYDVSHSGMGFYSECSAEKGQIVKIFLKHIFMDPIVAEVKWCNQNIDNLYRIGIKYVGRLKMDFTPRV